MSKNLRAVLDTNVLISALLKRYPSFPHQIYLAFKQHKFVLVTSASILEEIEEVINRKAIVRRTRMSVSERKEFMEKLVEVSFVVPGFVNLEVVEEDPDDDKFISAAIEGKADYIVSGDRHLLNLKGYEDIKTITPRRFIDLLDSNTSARRSPQ